MFFLFNNIFTPYTVYTLLTHIFSLSLCHSPCLPHTPVARLACRSWMSLIRSLSATSSSRIRASSRGWRCVGSTRWRFTDGGRGLDYKLCRTYDGSERSAVFYKKIISRNSNLISRNSKFISRNSKFTSRNS